MKSIYINQEGLYNDQKPAKIIIREVRNNHAINTTKSSELRYRYDYKLQIACKSVNLLLI
ncbi:unnamed protein product [Cunninghamella echinulata]